jgi:hypothetical protein
MSGNTKYKAGCSWEDIAVYLTALGREHNLGVTITLEGGHVVGAKMLQVEVRLWEIRLDLEGRRESLQVNRGGILKRGDAQASQLMLIVQQAYHYYLNDPWCWTLQDRKREVAESTEQ